MKKRLIILFISILIIYIFNINFINDLYYTLLGNYYYNNKDYRESIIYHKNIVSNNKGFFLGGDYYKLEKYKKSLELYNKIIKSDFKEKYKLYHNIGNIYYKLGENISNKKEKLDFFYKAKEQYKLSLDFKGDNYKTRNNYYFILGLIQELQDKKEKTNKNSKYNSLNNTLEFDNSLGQNNKNIENYINSLKKEEKYNKQFLNIKTINNNSDLLNSYFYEKLDFIYGDSSILEKDW